MYLDTKVKLFLVVLVLTTETQDNFRDVMHIEHLL